MFTLIVMQNVSVKEIYYKKGRSYLQILYLQIICYLQILYLQIICYSQILYLQNICYLQINCKIMKIHDIFLQNINQEIMLMIGIV